MEDYIVALHVYEEEALDKRQLEDRHWTSDLVIKMRKWTFKDTDDGVYVYDAVRVSVLSSVSYVKLE